MLSILTACPALSSVILAASAANLHPSLASLLNCCSISSFLILCSIPKKTYADPLNKVHLNSFASFSFQFCLLLLAVCTFVKSPPPIHFLSFALPDSATSPSSPSLSGILLLQRSHTQPVLCHWYKENNYLPDLPKTCFVLERFPLFLPFFSSSPSFNFAAKKLAILSFAFFHQLLLLYFTFFFLSFFFFFFLHFLLYSLLLNSPPFHRFFEGSRVLFLAVCFRVY